MILSKIDHVVLAVPDLEEGIAYVEKATGRQAVVGGIHPGRGTKNALLKIGKDQYLEILAPDTAQDVDAPWMGLKYITEPTITRWCIKSSSWEKELMALEAYDKQLALHGPGARQKPNGDVLEWKLTYPAAQPQVELVPFVIDWKEIHPCDSLAGDLNIYGFKLFGTPSVVLEDTLKKLNCPLQINYAPIEKIELQLVDAQGKIMCL